MERLELDDADLAQIEALADSGGATALLELLRRTSVMRSGRT